MFIRLLHHLFYSTQYILVKDDHRRINNHHSSTEELTTTIPHILSSQIYNICHKCKDLTAVLIAIPY